MKCPKCQSWKLRVYDSRRHLSSSTGTPPGPTHSYRCDDGMIWRRRKCRDCGFKFTTYETICWEDQELTSSDLASELRALTEKVIAKMEPDEVEVDGEVDKMPA